ncbi:MAG TPA: DUF427 domain-containing protein [Streptosporangiaceae bacterium]
MSLSSPFNTAPLGPRRGEFDFRPPGHIRYWEPWPRRMRAVVSGETVLDSRRGIVLWETGMFPAYYFPLDDLREDLLEESGGNERGSASRRWSVRVGGRLVKDCITASPRGRDGSELLAGCVTFHQRHGPQDQADPQAMDLWFEEDDPVSVSPRDPYHRVDVRSSSRHVVVRHKGWLVAESGRPKLMFETGNPIRYYLPLADVRAELLRKSGFVSPCPYKGDGQHWHLAAGGDTVENAAWSLPHPLPEGAAAAGHVCFYPDKLDVEVDGIRIPQ